MVGRDGVRAQARSRVWRKHCSTRVPDRARPSSLDGLVIQRSAGPQPDARARPRRPDLCDREPHRPLLSRALPVRAGARPQLHRGCTWGRSRFAGGGHYVPIVTTILAVPFALEIFAGIANIPSACTCVVGDRYRHLRVGTFTEAATTLIGWNEPTFRLVHLGALLGGAPIAQGTVLLLSRRTAHALTAILLAFVSIASVAGFSRPSTTRRSRPIG